MEKTKAITVWCRHKTGSSDTFNEMGQEVEGYAIKHTCMICGKTVYTAPKKKIELPTSRDDKNPIFPGMDGETT